MPNKAEYCTACLDRGEISKEDESAVDGGDKNAQKCMVGVIDEEDGKMKCKLRMERIAYGEKRFCEAVTVDDI